MVIQHSQSGYSLLTLRRVYPVFFGHFPIVIVLFVHLSCHKQQIANVYQSKPLYSHRLVQVDSLTFISTDSLFVSRTAQIAFWNGRILISDFYQKKLRVFDSHMNYVMTVGTKGSGPGEFQNFPGIMAESNGIWLIDEANWRANKYDDHLQYKLQRTLPHGYYFDRSPISLQNKFIFDGHRAHVMYEREDFREYKPLTAIDTSFLPIREFWEWNEIYFSTDRATRTYAQNNPHVLLTNGKNRSFYALQKATYLITHFDNELGIIRTFGLRPRYYKNPPAVTYEQTAFSAEMISEYAGNTTRMLALACDSSTGVVCLNYVNLDKDVFWQRTMLAGKHFLQVFDANTDCIFDGAISGKLAFVWQGRIVVQTDERPELIRFIVFRLERI